MMLVATTLGVLFAAAFLAMALLYARTKKYTGAALARYSGIIDLEAEQATLAAANRQLHQATVASQQRSAEEHTRLLQQSIAMRNPPS
jgi:hypothetical protein